jgi:T-complex protein 1 subunit delta
MLVELSEAQDVEAGDGTTSVVVIAGALLSAAEHLLQTGIHPSAIAESFRVAAQQAEVVLKGMSVPLTVGASTSASTDYRAQLIRAASTSLNSKIVAQYAQQIAAIAVDAVLSVRDPLHPTSVDLKNVRVVCKTGGSIEDMKIVPGGGVILNQPVVKSADGAPTRMEKARIALIQFQLSPPKTDMENQIVVTDYQQMDRILREERQYTLNMVKRIKKTGCNVLLIQKSILRDAVSEMALHYLAKSKILVVKDVERDEVEFVCKSVGCRPIADIDSFSEERLGGAELVEERQDDGSRYVVVEGPSVGTTTGTSSKGKTCSILVRGSNQVVLEEVERSLHDCLCAVRCLVKTPATIAGGGAPEIELAVRLSEWSRTLSGVQSRCVESYADALQIVPTILAENAGLPAIEMVTELRARHAKGEHSTGVNVRRGAISDMVEEGVVQPLHVTLSAVQLSTETVCMIMKIDDLVQTR